MIIKRMAWAYLLFSCYIIACRAFVEKPIVVIIPSFNNAQWYQNNLDSVFSQEYNNYHIIYIDDCSTDGTGDLVNNYITQCGMQEKVHLIRNQKNKGALYNLYRAIHTCFDNEIIVTIDGDDWFKHNLVLQRINQAYQDPQVWMTYGQFESYPSGRVGFCKSFSTGVSHHNAYREVDWLASHLRTFYAGFFKRIKLKDLIYLGQFFPVTWDMAFMYPMLEMSGGKHYQCILDVLYVYNEGSPLNDFKTKLLLQLHCDKHIRSMPKYEPISSYERVLPESKAAAVIIFQGNVTRLERTLNSLEEYVKDLEQIYVLDISDMQDNTWIQRRFAQCSITYSTTNVATSLHELLMQMPYEYVLICKDSAFIMDLIDVKKAITMLEDTYALGFYFCLGRNVRQNAVLRRPQQQPKRIELDGDICTWRFVDGEHAWRKPFDLSCTLFKKRELINTIQGLSCNSVQQLESALLAVQYDLHNVGLYYERAKTRLLDNDNQKDIDDQYGFQTLIPI